MTFKQDLELGKKIEHIVCDHIIKKKYPNSFVVDGYNKEFDIEIPEKGVTVEVKYDQLSDKTGNYMFETEYDGKPSGIETTTANWWLQVDNQRTIWIDSTALKYILKDIRVTKMGGIGDSKCKAGYLVPINKILYSPYVFVCKHSDIIKNLISNL